MTKAAKAAGTKPAKATVPKPASAATTFEQIMADPILTLAFFNYCCGKYVVAETYPKKAEQAVIQHAREHLTKYGWQVPDASQTLGNYRGNWVQALMAEKTIIINMASTDTTRLQAFDSILNVIRGPMMANPETFKDLAGEFYNRLRAQTTIASEFKPRSEPIPMRALLNMSHMLTM